MGNMFRACHALQVPRSHLPSPRHGSWVWRLGLYQVQKGLQISQWTYPALFCPQAMSSHSGTSRQLLLYLPPKFGWYVWFLSCLPGSDSPQEKPCRPDGEFLPPGMLPSPPPPKSADNWTPFILHARFKAAEILYTKAPFSNDAINQPLNLWTATLIPYESSAPILNQDEFHTTINAIKLGCVPWQLYTAQLMVSAQTMPLYPSG